MKNIKPLGDRVLIQVPKEAEQTQSGIIIPDTASKERPQQGKVIAVGEGRRDENGKRIPLDVTEGDTILFTKYGPDEVEIDGEEYLVLSEKDILAVIS